MLDHTPRSQQPPLFKKLSESVSEYAYAVFRKLGVAAHSQTSIRQLLLIGQVWLSSLLLFDFEMGRRWLAARLAFFCRTGSRCALLWCCALAVRVSAEMALAYVAHWSGLSVRKCAGRPCCLSG